MRHSSDILEVIGDLKEKAEEDLAAGELGEGGAAVAGYEEKEAAPAEGSAGPEALVSEEEVFEGLDLHAGAVEQLRGRA